MIRTRRVLHRAILLGSITWIALALTLACHEGDSEGLEAIEVAWPEGDLIDVAVPAAEHAIVLSADGRIHTTRDGGGTWRLARVPAVGPLRGISMAGPRVGWAFGAGVILKTEDGGEGWWRQRLPGRAADFDFARIAAIDEERALVVGDAGLRLRTIDGGALWQDFSLVPVPPEEMPPSFVDLACAPDRSGRCWSVDRQIRFTPDAGASWRVLELEDAMSIPPVEFGFGQVEIPDAMALVIREAVAGRPHAADLRWVVDAGVSALEMDRIGDGRDPSALFDLVEARIAELRSMLEVLGVNEREIETRATPPWGYEDRIDDDPDVLVRYWSTRVEVGARGRVHTRERISVGAVDVDAAGNGIGVGRAGRGVRAVGADRRWRPVALDVPHDLFDVATTAERIIAVGLQGGLWASSDGGEIWQSVGAAEAGVFFEALRSVSFDPGGRLGFVVGAKGRLLRSRDGGASWQLLARKTQADQPAFR